MNEYGWRRFEWEPSECQRTLLPQQRSHGFGMEVERDAKSAGS